MLPLKISDLNVTSGAGRLLLNLPVLDLPVGASLGIRGPSGAGKTTLLFALAGLLEGVRGRVLWGETDLMALGAEDRAAFRARHLGLIFQDFLLFDELSALANAGLPAMFAPRVRRRAITSRGAEALASLGLLEPTRGVDSFSGGERQRVAVARALAANPDVLLADEPTASLDRAASDRLIRDLTALVRGEGKSLIVVSHDPALLGAMDRVLDVVDGRVTEAV